MQRKAYVDRKQVRERWRMELDAGHAGIRVPVYVRVDGKVRVEQTFLDETELGERAVERRHIVPLRQEEIVARGIAEAVGRDPKNALVREAEEAGTRERGS